ncbi:MAG: NAD(P)-dependent oxidoreductase [Actinomycetota bacterium]|nr:NAD(P)-dependent oxidoreductase [Actinomycetota bacterium]
MRVFVAGATGVAGRRAVRALVAQGHYVTAVSRSTSKKRLLETLGAVPVELDVFDPGEVQVAVQGQDAIVNLATKIPPLNRAMIPGAWAENNRIRTHVSRNLVTAGLAGDVERYIQESLAFMYPDQGDAWIDEEVAVDPPRYASSVLNAEAQAARFTKEGRKGVVLRFGQFYAPDAVHTRSMIATARRGISPFVGPPDAFSPVVHADDVAGAVVAALEASPGVYNVVDDEPLRQRQLADALASALSRAELRFPPSALMRLGGAKVRMLMRSQRVSNRRFRGATSWTPKFPSARHGLQVTVEQAEGVDA